MKYVGIDIGGTNVKLVVSEGGREVLARGLRPTDAKDPERTAAEIAALMAEYSGGDVLPAGIACAGDVDSGSGVISADNLGWHQVPFGPLLRKKTDAPFVLLHDIYAAATAEWRLGAMRGAQNAVYVGIGTGIGASVIADGRPYQDVRHGSCEIGHMITHVNGRRCACGNRGCFEQYASSSALARMGGGARSAREIVAAAKAGEPEALRIWKKYIGELCAGLMNVLAVFAPEVLCLGGGITENGEFFLRSVTDGMKKHAYYRDWFTSTPIRLAELGNEAGALGAAMAARERLVLR